MLVYTLYKFFLSVVNIHHVLQSTSYQLYMFTIVPHYICWSICFHISSYQLCIFIHPVFCPFYACPCTCIVRLISCVYSPLFCPMFASSCPSQVRLISCIFSPLFCPMYMLFHNLSMYVISYVHIYHCSIPGFIPLYAGPRAFIVHFISCIYSQLFCPFFGPYVFIVCLISCVNPPFFWAYVCWSICFQSSSYKLYIFNIFRPLYAGPYCFIVCIISCVNSTFFCSLYAGPCPFIVCIII